MRYAYARVRNQSVAEDLVQETFLAAVKGLDKFEGRSKERTWLTGILKFKVLDYYRKRSRDKEDMFSEVANFYEREVDEMFPNNNHWDFNGTATPRAWDNAQVRNLDNQEFMAHFEVCSDKLPNRIREVFVLREIDGLSTEDICDKVGISRANLWTILHRARAALRKCLEENLFAPAS